MCVCRLRGMRLSSPIVRLVCPPQSNTHHAADLRVESDGRWTISRAASPVTRRILHEHVANVECTVPMESLYRMRLWLGLNAPGPRGRVRSVSYPYHDTT